MVVQVLVRFRQLSTVPSLFLGFIHIMCVPQSQSPVLRPFKEFNILLEPRGTDSGSIPKNWSGDYFVNCCHLLLRFVHEASFSHPCLPVYLATYQLNVVSGHQV